jgi:putative transposon-encoded protein
MDVHDICLVHLVCSFSPQLVEINIYTVYIHFILFMVRRMIATITRIESVVTPSGNSGHVVVPKAWIGKEAIVTLKQKESKDKGKKK